MTILIFLLVLSFLVFITEMGHYLAARHVGVRVESFSIGFPPRVWSKRIGETEYMVSAIPLGGYVRLFGQNTMDEDPSDPRNYASKTILQRLYILVAGPLANLLLALLFMPLVYWMGTPAPAYLNEIPEIRSVQAGSLAESMGLEGGELILKVNGQETFSWQAVNDQISAIPPGENLVLEYERAGRIQQAQVPIREFYQAGGAGWNPVIPPVVGNLVSGAPAERAGLASGDRILRINETLIGDWTDISKTVQDLHPDGIAPQPLTVAVDRGGESWEFELTPYQDSDSGRLLIGMSMGMVVQSHSLGEAIVKGSDRLVSMVVSTFTFIGQMLSGNGSVDELGGPVRIGMVIGEAAESGWTNLFFMVAVISLQLGIFNLLPIPALDGGHILMLAMEKVKGSPLSVAMRERTQMIGFSVLIMLMLFVTYNDLLQVWD